MFAMIRSSLDLVEQLDTAHLGIEHGHAEDGETVDREVPAEEGQRVHDDQAAEAAGALHGQLHRQHAAQAVAHDDRLLEPALIRIGQQAVAHRVEKHRLLHRRCAGKAGQLHDVALHGRLQRGAGFRPGAGGAVQARDHDHRPALAHHLDLQVAKAHGLGTAVAAEQCGGNAHGGGDARVGGQDGSGAASVCLAQLRVG